MASFNVSLDDSSPLISYAPASAWIDTPDNDTVLAQYQDQSLHVSAVKNATATLQFNGTGIWFYGGRSPDYGTYTLTVDNQVVSSGSSLASNVTAQQLLAAATSLGMGEHTAVLANAGTGAVDIDSVVFESEVGATSGAVSYAIIEDGSSNITYSGSDWAFASGSMFSNNGTHYTQTNGATASIMFDGDAVAVYGGASFDHGNYTVSLDGMLQQYNGGSDGQVRMYHPQTMLYFATNLGNGSHTLTFTNNAIGNASFLDIDQIGVYISPSYSNVTSSAAIASTLNGTYPAAQYPAMPQLQMAQADPAANASAAGAASTSSTKKGMSKSTLAALIIFSILAFVLITSLIVFLIKRRTKKIRKSKELSSPVLPMQEDPEKGLPFDNGPAYPIFKRDDSFVSSDNFDTQVSLNRSVSTRTSATKWSQFSTDSEETLKADPPTPKLTMPEPTSTPRLPPVTPLALSRTNLPPSPAQPPMPTPPAMPMPTPMHGRERSGSVSSDARSPGGSDYSDDDFASYYRDSVLGPGHNDAHPSATPTRPHRPPGLELQFSPVQL
ncbi:hypothetical protein EUX98_g4983 [Antrodiella citrinella]|uniref:Transmembrane protein n=1 Tax=Antrodiella citrinella TaxID=2447956 RepID=A0A4S4MTL0_9APHY|nr:hypothetical protein EUX98_g4983 [Antrodiella citrinella]